jgi:predicted ATP-grasp superfamily ATP-dependent carboligase
MWVYGMSDRPRVLITNAEERSMLAVCRSLRRGGYDVTAAACTALAPAQWSRSCAHRLRIVDARTDANQFIEQLRQELARHAYAALIPGSDSALLAISEQREHLSELAEIGLPSPSVIERVLSRESLAEVAEQVGLVPAVSIRCVGVEQALAAARQLGFPVVLKATKAASLSDQAVTGAPKGQVISSEAELAQRVRAFPNGLLIQRWAGDDLVSFGGVIGGGHLLGVAVSRYRRMWPPDSGSVAFGETIPPPARLEEMVERLLIAIGWEGIFELELIQSAPGEFVPIDLNPRPYGSMALASAAGAPLAAIWCDWLLGRATYVADDRPIRARPGVRYRWEDGDLRHALWQLRHGRPRSALGPFRPWRDVAHAHFQGSDPLPLLARGLYMGNRLWQDRPTRTR